MSEMPLFDGPFLVEADHARLGRQLDVVRCLMLDGRWRTLGQIEECTGYPQASVSARLRDLRKPRFGGYAVERQRRSPGTYEYRVTGGAR